MKKDIIVEIDPLTRCNLRCHTCPQGRREMPNNSKPMCPIKLDTWLNIISKQRNIRTISIYWAGEPFLHPHLEEIVRVCNVHCKDVLVITNGNGRMTSLESYAKHEPKVTSVSLSGWTQEVYGRHHVGGLVNNAREFILKAHRLGMKSIQLNCHLYPDTLPELPMWEKFAKSLGYPLITRFPAFLFMDDWKKNIKYDDYFMDVDEIIKFAPVNKECMTMDTMIAISPSGEYYHCENINDLSVPVLGSVETVSVDEHIAMRRSSSICKECMSKGYSYMSNGNQVLPDFVQIWRANKWNLKMYLDLPIRKLLYQYKVGYRKLL